MTKERSFSIILTINIMQQRGMSWRVLRYFKTSVVNVLRLLRPLIYNFLGGIKCLKCLPLKGCITPRKVAETSTQLYGFEECHGESFAVCNQASLKSLAFAASDSSKS